MWTIIDLVSPRKQRGGAVGPRYAWKVENPCKIVYNYKPRFKFKFKDYIVLASEIGF